MMPASKHGDPQLGVDIHLCVVPPSPSPVPLPTPHTSIVFDPFDYIPIIGATITVCGMKRATAGTNGMAIHIPPGFPFAPKLPDKDDELFMGSSTVVADGDPFSFIAVPVLSCQIAGMMSPFRAKKKGGVKAMVLPTVFNLAIPTTVFVGGPPTISLMGMAFKGAFAALGKFAKSGLFKRIRQKLFKNLNPGFLKCKILRAEPVNILTGEVVVEQEDFKLPGRIPIEWVRSYTSGTSRPGACGYGWETLVDSRLEVDPVDGTVSMRHPTAGPLFFERLPAATGDAAFELELMDGARLSDHDTEFQVRTKEDRVYHFPKALAAIGPMGALEYPIGLIADLCGNWLEFERRDQRVVAINESAGRRIEIVSRDGRIHEVALVVPGTAGRHVYARYEYDSADDLTAVVDALGSPHRFFYDEHHLVRHTDRRGLSFCYDYDTTAEAGWRVVHSWGDGGLYDYQFAYDDVLRERRISDSLGHVSLVKLDERGLPIGELDPLGGITIFEYDEAGRASAVVDPDGYRTALRHDDRGNLVELKLPDGASIRAQFDDRDRVVHLEDGTGAAWEQTWDDRGLLVAQRSPLGHRSRFNYDDYGQLVAYVNAQGGRSELAFDAVGQVATLTDPLGHATHYTWDLLGNALSRRDAHDRLTVYRYDAKQRLTEIQQPSGAIVRCTYDGANNLVAFTDDGGTTRLSYAGQGLVSTRTRANGQGVRYVFDTEERLTAVTNQHGATYHLRRDALGRIIEETDYWGQSRQHRYSAGGRLLESVDPLKRRLLYETDPAGRVVKRTMLDPDSVEAPAVETFKYDGNGNLTGCENEHIRIERTYDAEGRLVLERQGSDFTLRNAFDALGNRLECATVLRRGEQVVAQSVRFSYDAAGRAVAIGVGDHPPLEIERDEVGQIVAEQLTSAIRRERSYSAGGQLLRQTTRRANETVADVAYSYDALGNVTERRDFDAGVESFTYDPVGRITAHLDPQGTLTRYAVDAAGDRFSAPIAGAASRARDESIGADDERWLRESDDGGSRYRFDRAGQLVRRDDDRGELALVWDPSQRLVQATLAGAVTRYRYDPLGRRIEKCAAGVVTRFCWDGDICAVEATARPADGAPRAVRRFVYYPQSFVPVAVCDAEDSAAGPLWYHNDPNGAPTRLTDRQGTTMWSASYSATGRAVLGRVARVSNPIRLQGQYEDVETGLCYNRHRYFAPEVGQFISQDPIGLVGGSNVYSYGENITRWIDPAGLTGVITNKFPDEELPADGRIVPHTIDDKGKIKLDTPGQREFDFVVTKDNQLVIGKRHHLLGDRSDVLAAGQMKISGDGRVRRIDNLSGHYRPTAAEADGFADALRKAGVNVSGATLQPWEIIVDGNGNVINTRRLKPCGL